MSVLFGIIHCGYWNCVRQSCCTSFHIGGCAGNDDEDLSQRFVVRPGNLHGGQKDVQIHMRLIQFVEAHLKLVSRIAYLGFALTQNILLVAAQSGVEARIRSKLPASINGRSCLEELFFAARADTRYVLPAALAERVILYKWITTGFGASEKANASHAFVRGLTPRSGAASNVRSM